MSENKPRFGLMPIPYEKSYFNMLQKGELMLDRNSADLYTKDDRGNIISKTYNLGVDVEKIKTSLYNSTNQLCFSGNELYDLEVSYNDISDKNNNYGFPFIIANHGLSIKINPYDYFFKISHFDKIIVKVRFAVYAKDYAQGNPDNILFDGDGTSDNFINISLNDYKGLSKYKIISQKIQNASTNASFKKRSIMYEYQTEFICMDNLPSNFYDSMVFYNDLTTFNSNNNLVTIDFLDASEVLNDNNKLISDIYITDIDMYKENDLAYNDIRLPLVIDNSYIYRHPGYIQINKNKTDDLVNFKPRIQIGYNLIYDITIFKDRMEMPGGIYSLTFILNNYINSNKYIYIELNDKNYTSSNNKIIKLDLNNIKKFNDVYIITTTLKIDEDIRSIYIYPVSDGINERPLPVRAIKIDPITTASFDDYNLITKEDLEATKK